MQDEKEQWKEVQQHNREAYHYRKFLKNRYLKMTESVQNSAERYKGSTIDLSLPQINYVENKRELI